MTHMSSVDLFPSFQSLTLDIRKEYDDFVAQFDCYSDFNFVSLWTYMGHQCKVSRLNDNLVFHMIDYKDHQPFLALLGNSHISRTLHDLFDYLKKTSLPIEIRLVPAALVHDTLDNLPHYHFRLDRDNFDYVIDITQFIQLSSNQFKSKRGEIKRFTSRNKAYEIRPLQIHTSEDRSHIMKLVKHWASQDAHATEYNDLEAIHKLLLHAKDFQTIDVGLFLHGELRAFTINELLPKNTYMGHFGKADKSLSGIYTVIEYETAKLMHEKHGCTYLNLQQDLGLPNLRRSKMSYKPFKFLEKGTIRQKATLMKHSKL